MSYYYRTKIEESRRRLEACGQRVQRALRDPDAAALWMVEAWREFKHYERLGFENARRDSEQRMRNILERMDGLVSRRGRIANDAPTEIHVRSTSWKGEAEGVLDDLDRQELVRTRGYDL